MSASATAVMTCVRFIESPSLVLLARSRATLAKGGGVGIDAGQRKVREFLDQDAEANVFEGVGGQLRAPLKAHDRCASAVGGE
jgi:hypothetical protein